jgi:hypothetical protein
MNTCEEDAKPTRDNRRHLLEMVRLHVEISAEAKASLEKLAADAGQSQGAVVEKLIWMYESNAIFKVLLRR